MEDPLLRPPKRNSSSDSDILFYLLLFFEFFKFIGFGLFGITFFLGTITGPYYFRNTTDPSFSITSVSLSNYTLNVRLNVSNPNSQASIVYKHIGFSLYYNKYFYLSTAKPILKPQPRFRGKPVEEKPIIQAEGEVVAMDLVFPELGALLVDGAGVSGRVLYVDLTGLASVVVEDGVWRGIRTVSVWCDDVGVAVEGGGLGRMVGGGGRETECRVRSKDLYSMIVSFAKFSKF